MVFLYIENEPATYICTITFQNELSTRLFILAWKKGNKDFSPNNLVAMAKDKKKHMGAQEPHCQVIMGEELCFFFH